jgi:preprotein translocase subunit YajC
VLKYVQLLKEDPMKCLNQLLKLPFNTFFDSLSYKTILAYVVIFLAAFYIQLRLSRRARQWTKTLVHLMAFGSTFFVLIVLGILILIKASRQQQKRVEARIEAQRQQAAVDMSCTDSSLSNYLRD